MKVAVDCERFCVDGSVIMLAMQNVCLLEEQAEEVVRQVCWDQQSNISYLLNTTT
jgi:hypothetical protein